METRNSMKYFMVMIFALAFLGAFEVMGHAEYDGAAVEDAGGTIQRVSGTVEALDWTGSTITINAGNMAQGGDGEMTFKVADDALITRAGDGIGLADIEVSDEVEVRYIDNPDGMPVAKQIDDMNLANE